MSASEIIEAVEAALRASPDAADIIEVYTDLREAREAADEWRGSRRIRLVTVRLHRHDGNALVVVRAWYTAGARVWAVAS